MMALLSEKWKVRFVSTTEEFNGSTDGIWTTVLRSGLRAEAGTSSGTIQEQSCCGLIKTGRGKAPFVHLRRNK